LQELALFKETSFDNNNVLVSLNGSSVENEGHIVREISDTFDDFSKYIFPGKNDRPTEADIASDSSVFTVIFIILSAITVFTLYVLRKKSSNKKVELVELANIDWGEDEKFD